MRRGRAAVEERRDRSPGPSTCSTTTTTRTSTCTSRAATIHERIALIPDALLRNEGRYPAGSARSDLGRRAADESRAPARARRWSTSIATAASTSQRRTGPIRCASMHNQRSRAARATTGWSVELVGTRARTARRSAASSTVEAPDGCRARPAFARPTRRSGRAASWPVTSGWRTRRRSITGLSDHLAERAGAGGGDDGGRPARARGAGRVAVPTAVPEAWDGGPACGASRCPQGQVRGWPGTRRTGR
jgi:hypothetical protein